MIIKNITSNVQTSAQPTDMERSGIFSVNAEPNNASVQNTYVRIAGSSLTEKARRSVACRGAMFGLDARIALAIFGMLSVVAGATAINVLGGAAVTALVTEFNNVKKSYQEFHLATGDHTTRFKDLIDNESGIPGWAGPYIDLTSDRSRQHGTYSLIEGRQDVPGVPPVECTGGGICSVFLKLTRVKDSLAAEADKNVDGEESANSGAFRIEFTPGGTDDVYFILAPKPAS